MPAHATYPPPPSLSPVSRFDANYADAVGGAVYMTGSSAFFEKTTFYDNRVRRHAVPCCATLCRAALHWMRTCLCPGAAPPPAS
jgi:hypothetical protein